MNHYSSPFEAAVHLLLSFDISMDWGPTQSLSVLNACADENDLVMCRLVGNG